MLRLTIELVPFGNEENRKTLSTITIINDRTGNAQFGNYIIKRDHWDKDNRFPANDEFKIKRYNRFDGYMKLISKVINKFVRLDLG